jgi:hypothetical protein
MTTRLILFNSALALLGERRLTTTSDARDARYHLDDAYTVATAFCLEAGFWNFAMRAVEIDQTPALAPSFGFTYGFAKPSDWVRTYIVSPNDRLEEWILRMNDEAGVWYADIDPIYVKYVSNSASYGMDLSAWPQTFADYVSARLALLAGPSISTVSSDKLDEIAKEEKRRMHTAKNKDAMNEAPQFALRGSWVNARRGAHGGSYAVAGGRIFY